LARSGDPTSSSSMSEPSVSDRVKCDVCGADNPAVHKFCGSCGAPLEDERALPPQVGETGAHGTGGDRRDDAKPGSNSTPAVFEDSITNPNELSLFRSFRPAANDDVDDWEPEPSRIRLYIGVFVVVVVMGLGYLSWRTSRAASQHSHEQPAQAPVKAKETNPTPSAPRSTPQVNKLAQAPPSTDTEAHQTPAQERKTEKPAATAAAAPIPSTAANAAGDGGEELAMAQHYLNGPGHDSAEAAKWLWKSIAKQNAEATLLLADLYLKGDGVSKNCDQARVLLDSAARKGVSGAGERIRNLQAFGCQ
jgi:hypothetical protein